MPRFGLVMRHRKVGCVVLLLCERASGFAWKAVLLSGKWPVPSSRGDVVEIPREDDGPIRPDWEVLDG